MASDVLDQLALIAIGTTWFSALVLSLGHLSSELYAERPWARRFGLALLLNLSVLQGMHYWALVGELHVWSSSLYIASIFCTGALFFFFCRAVLRFEQPLPRWAWAALMPPLIGAVAPGQIMFFVAFVIGAGYFLAIGAQLFVLRSQRRRFAAELTALVALFIISGMTLLLGLLLPWIEEHVYVSVFAILNGLSFVPALLLAVRYPDLLNRAEEALVLAEANSTLRKVDVASKRRELDRLMGEEHLYRDETLNLAALADQLQLSSHQTSELLNQHVGMGFARYLRKHRVADACQALLAQPRESVLSIGLNAGFSSQSTFYTAFKQETGLSPGQYRKTPQDSPTG
ncbi:MAG: helix-turn-helix transcriptional regulator [Pseudomonadota bacterium]